MANWYVSSVKWTAVAAWTATTAYVIGNIIRQNATPTVGNERVFRCTTAGTSLGTEPTWVVTKGATTTETAGPVWTEITGQAIFNGDGGGTAWAAPHARLGNALTTNWVAAGDTVYVDGGAFGVSPHAETQTTNIVWASVMGTTASPIRILCVDNQVVLPTTLATTASVTMNGAGLIMQLFTSGAYAYIYGVKFIAQGSSSITYIRTNSAVGFNSSLIYDSCTFDHQCTNANGFFSHVLGAIQQVSNYSEYKNCSFLTAANNPIAFNGGNVLINGGTFSASGTVPTPAFVSNPSSQANGGNVVIRDADLSVYTGTLYSASVGPSSLTVRYQNCRINGSAVMSPAPGQFGGQSFRLENCDSTNTNYRYFLSLYGGTAQQETTIVRTGGDTDGTTALSWKIVSNANNKTFQPMELDPLVVWNDVTGSSKTLTVEIASNATLTNADVWVEIEYPSSASYPLGSGLPQSTFASVSSRVANVFATAASVTASTKAWDSLVTARANTTAYVLGNIYKVASNPGRVFICTTAGTSAASEPAGLASATDGSAAVTDGTAAFQAMVRQAMTVTFTPQAKGPVKARVFVGKASQTLYVDPIATIV